MKSLVVYSSKSGNTKKLAETVYEKLPGPKEIHPITEDPDPAAYDLIAIGFWLQAGKPDLDTQNFLTKITKQKVFLFATHGAAKASQHATNAMNHTKNLLNGADIVGTYSCQGEVNPNFLEKAAAKPEPPPWIGDSPLAKGHPDSNDLKELSDLVVKLA